MTRMILVAATVVLLAVACSGSDVDGVASLEETATTIAEEATSDSAADDEEILLEFAACMRENGAEGFEDPSINADGVPEFGFRGSADEVDRDAMEAAFEACQDKLEGLAFGPGSIDLTEVEDTLVEFAGCMRDNGYDMPDPDLSNIGNRGEGGSGGGPGGGPFGGDIDPDDPDFLSALEECESIFETLPFVGRGPGGGRNG